MSNLPNSADTEQGKVILEDDGLFSRGFTQVPNAVLRDSSLSDGAKLTYAMLLSYAWSDDSSFPGQERLAQDLGKESRSVRRHLTELKDIGLIRVERRGLGKTNIYYIKTRFEADRTKMSDQDRTKMSHLDRTKMSHKEYKDINNTQDNNTKYSRKGKTQEERRKQESTGVSKRGASVGLTPVSNLLGHAIDKILPDHHRPPTIKGNWKKAPVFIQATIGEWFSPEMNDEAISATITRVHRIFISWVEARPDLQGQAAEDTFSSLMQEARSKAKHAKIKKRTATGATNQTPFFLACLEEMTGLRSSDGKPRDRKSYSFPYS